MISVLAFTPTHNNVMTILRVMSSATLNAQALHFDWLLIFFNVHQLEKKIVHKEIPMRFVSLRDNAAQLFETYFGIMCQQILLLNCTVFSM